jgi:hypothetical protein
MRFRRRTISVAFAAALAALPLSTAEAQSTQPAQYYPPCSPFPLAWPFCAVGAVLGVVATIVTLPFWALAGAPPPYYGGYYGPPYYPPPYYPPGYYAPPYSYGPSAPSSVPGNPTGARGPG